MAESPLIRSPRLVLRELGTADLPSLLPVFLSNPDFLALRGGSGVPPDGYDLETLERDWAVGRLDPLRHQLGMWLEEELVGILDYVEESPGDGCAWVGLVMVHADHQRRGLATEALQALSEQAQRDGRPAVRMGVMRDDPSGMAFAGQAGFTSYGTAIATTAAGEQPVVLMERRLAD